MAMQLDPQLIAQLLPALQALMGQSSGAAQNPAVAALAGQGGNPYAGALASLQNPQSVPVVDHSTQALPGTVAPQPTMMDRFRTGMDAFGNRLNTAMGDPMFGAGMGILGATTSGGNPYTGALAGMYGSGIYKQRTQQNDLAIQEEKLRREQAKTVSQMAQDALKNIDVDQDGVVSPAEQARAEVIKIAQLTGNPEYLQKASDMLGGMQPKPNAPTSAMLNVEALGYKPGTPEYAAELNRILTTPRTSVATTINNIPKPPTGYTYSDPTNPAAGVAAIPGGPADPTNPQNVDVSDKNARYAAEGMLNADKAAEDVISRFGFDPSKASNLWANTPVVGNFLASPEYQQYNAAADEWTTNEVYLRSGVTAREDEKASARRNFFGLPGDDKLTLLKKNVLRKQAMLEAYRKGYQSGRVVDPQGAEVIGRLQREAAIAEALYKKAAAGKAGSTGGVIPGLTAAESDRLRELEAELNAPQ